MKILKTYILSAISNRHPSTLIEQNHDIIFSHGIRQYAIGLREPDFDWFSGNESHDLEVEDKTIVPLLRSVSQKIIDYKN